MQSYFDDLLRYNHEANRELFVASAVGELQAVHKLISHILIAQKIWCHRISFPDTTLTLLPWDMMPPGEFHSFNDSLLETSLQEVHADREFSEVIAYVNTKGEHYKNTRAEIFTHILMHSTYHRGQAALLLRQHGFEPPVTDYIFSKRQPQ